jgi:hypothetical protein
MYGTWGRPCQAFGESRVLVDAGFIHLVLGKIFCPCEVSPLKEGTPERCPQKVGALELRQSKVGVLELRHV